MYVLVLVASVCHAGEAPATAPGEEAAAAPGKGEEDKYPKVKFGGFIQVFFKARRAREGDASTPGSAEPAVFRVQRARMKMDAKVTKHVDAQLEIDPRAPEITGIMRDAYLALDYLPEHEIRIGQQKTQFGYENSESSTRLWFVNRSEAADNLMRGNVTLRDIGLGLIGDVPLGDGDFRFEDAVTVVNGNGMNTQLDDTVWKNVWGRVGGRYEKDDILVRLGLSGAYGDAIEPFDPGPPMEAAYGFVFQRAGADLELGVPWIWFVAEGAWGRDEIEGEPEPETVLGWSTLVVLLTPPKVGPALRVDGFDTFRRVTLGAYVGLADDRVRVLANYEILEEEETPRDDRFYLWTQARF